MTSTLSKAVAITAASAWPKTFSRLCHSAAATAGSPSGVTTQEMFSKNSKFWQILQRFLPKSTQFVQKWDNQGFLFDNFSPISSSELPK